MNQESRWYENKILLLFSLLFIYPVGLIFLWIRETSTVKKVFFTVVGGFAALFTTTFTFGILFAIFHTTDYYALGMQDFESKFYSQAVHEFSQVPEGDEMYAEAQKKITEARELIKQEEARKESIRNTAYNDLSANVSPLVSGKQNYSVLLYDMESTEDVYQQKYKVVLENAEGIPYDTITDWMAVSDTTFDYFIEDQGMELMGISDQQVSRHSSPPGYNRYVGNTQYGTWRTDNNGDSFWEFYGKYAMLRSIFGYSRPVYQYSYHDYNDYYRGRTSYYGPPATTGKGYAYGTGSANASKQNPRGLSAKVQSRVTRSGSSGYTAKSSFKSNVNNSISRSSSRISRSNSRTSSMRTSSSSSRGGK